MTAYLNAVLQSNLQSNLQQLQIKLKGDKPYGNIT